MRGNHHGWLGAVALLVLSGAVLAQDSAQDKAGQQPPVPPRPVLKRGPVAPGLEQKMPARRPVPPRGPGVRARPFDTAFHVEPIISVRLRPGASTGDVVSAAEQQGVVLKVKAPPNALRIVDLEVSGGDVSKAKTALTGAPAVEFVESNWVGSYSGVTVNDPYFGDQWNLSNPGNIGGRVDADIDADDAWEMTQGAPNVIIAVIDSGMEWDHAELRQRLAINEAEFNGAPGVDDDSNGKVDDLVGWNFEHNDGDTRTSNDHGTAVAGIIAAAANDGVGIAGIAGGGPTSDGCSIIACSIGENQPLSSLVDDAILYAVERGAKVISLSIAIPFEQSVQLAIADAVSKGVVVVCAAGNDLSTVSYPASDPNVIPVASTGRSDCASSFSSPGDPLATGGLAAPGEEIVTLSLNAWGGYTIATGTSFAAPHVAGVVGLMFSLGLTTSPQPSRVRDVLRHSADPSTCGDLPTKVGAGRLNAASALKQLAGP